MNLTVEHLQYCIKICNKQIVLRVTIPFHGLVNISTYCILYLQLNASIQYITVYMYKINLHTK